MSALSRRKIEAGDRRSKTPLSRRFTLRYAVALILFSGVVIFGQVKSSSSTERVDDNSRLSRASSEQTSRLYRIAELVKGLSAQVNSGKPEQLAQAKNGSGDLVQELTTLGQVRTGLLQGDAALKLPKTAVSGPLSDVYKGAGQLDATIDAIMAQGGDLAAKASGPATTVDTGALLDNLTKAQSGFRQASKIYDDELQKALSDQRDTSSVLLAVFLLVAVAVGFGLFRPMARNIGIETGQLEEAERDHRLNNERQTFRNSLKETLESADTEEEVLATLGRAVRAVVPDLKAEILLVNATESRLVRGADLSDHGNPNCPVESPMGCAAFRRSQTEVFESSRMLNACPKLAAHAEGACSAVCVPLKFRGRALGVLHTTAADAHPPSHTQIERLTTIAAETGVQLGTVRATQSDRLQATTDGLTGLLNRRSLETATNGLLSENRTFSVAMADLDHFKDLNDTYGHEAGDTALKLFAKVLKANLRPDDVAARYGGEEFILVLPSTNIREAQAALERLQISLAQEIERVKGVPFTASWGLTDQSSGSGFDEMVGVADAALYSAKRAGRNCIYVDGEAASAYQELAPDQIWHDGPGHDDGASAGNTAEGGDGEAPLIQIDQSLLPPGVANRPGAETTT